MDIEVGEALSTLQSRWNALHVQWLTTRAMWHDGVGDRFEREFWGFWEDQMPQLLRSLDELGETLDAALRRTEEC